MKLGSDQPSAISSGKIVDAGAVVGKKLFLFSAES
jgi:hypothetical protein